MSIEKCKYCKGAEALIIGKADKPDDDDYGIAILHPNKLHAYGYDVHGSGSNGITVQIQYCPMCGRKLS